MAIVLAIVLFLLSALPVRAEPAKFKTSLLVNYIYTASGSSQVRQNFTVTNLTSRYLISNYEFQIPGSIPTNLSGRDSKGQLTLQTEKLNDATTLVRVIFNDIVAGIDHSLKFSLTHDGPALVQKGETREITLPNLSNFSSISNYSVVLTVPQSFGLLAFSSPPPTSHKTDSKSKTSVYTYDENLSENLAIQTIFGNFQSWGLKLDYEISNLENKVRSAYLLIPPDLSSQKIILANFSPLPKNVSPDVDGNWLALYEIPKKTTQKITISGQARLIFPEDFSSTPPNSSKIIFSPHDHLPQNAIKPYKTELYFETFSESSPDIRLTWDKPAQLFPVFCQTSLVHIKNEGSSAIQHLPLTLSAYGLKFKLNHPTIPIILPQGTVTLPLPVCATLKELFEPKYLTLSADKAKVTYNIPIQSVLLFYGVLVITITLTLILAATFTHHAWSVHLQKSKRRNHIRR